MKISKETLDVLKNFSAINPNLVIEQGNKLSTIAEAKNIMASCEVTETFDKDIGIYDLNEHLDTTVDRLPFKKNSAGSVALIRHKYLKVIDNLIMAFVKAVPKPKVE